MLANTIIELQLFEFYDTRNLTAIFKDNLVNEYFTSKLKVRLLNQYDELNNIVEAGQDAFNFLTSIDNSTLYCETIDFKLAGVVGADKKAHWYITKIEQSEDGGVYLFLKRDTLRDFYSLYSGDSVLVKTETQPTSSQTRNSGQNVSYTFQPFTNQVKNLFPYLYVNSKAWAGSFENNYQAGASCFILSIINNQALESRQLTNNFIDVAIGQDVYICDFPTLHNLIEGVTNPSLWEKLIAQFQGQNPQNMIRRIQRAPFELAGATIRIDSTDTTGNTGLIPIGFNSILKVSKESGADWGIKFLNRRIICTSTNYNEVQGFGYHSIGHNFVINYNINEVEKLELMLPFIEKVDLTGYLKLFNGTIVADYVIDTGTGFGFVGLHSSTTASLLSEDNKPNFDLIIPFNCYTDVEWIGTSSNTLDRVFTALGSVVGLASSYSSGGLTASAGLSAIQNLTHTANTQIYQPTSNKAVDRLIEALAGESKEYGVRKTLRSKGVINSGIYHTIQQFNTLTSVATTAQPTSDYNIITVDIAKRSWTGDDAIDNDIYTKLTQGGFVYNG